MKVREKNYDVFICHASEDKDSLVKPLASSLVRLGLSVWYDEYTLHIGDSLSASIDKGLSNSRFGLVVISQNFIRKPWPNYELRGLVNREVEQDQVLLPIWLGVNHKQVSDFSPTLADKISLIADDKCVQDIAIKLVRKIRPDLYEKHPRSKLEKMASGEILQDLEKEIKLTHEELNHKKEELADFQCPFCKSKLVSRIDAPADSLEKYWGTRDLFECGHRSYDGETEIPCPCVNSTGSIR